MTNTTSAVEADLYMPSDLPPQPGMDERGFWAFCAQKQLKFQRCGACGRHRHPPVPLGPVCQSDHLEWTEAPARATVYTYTIVHHAPHPSLRERVPYNVAVLSFAGLDDVRLISNVVDVSAIDMAIGLEVELVWQGPVAGYWLPRFRRVGSTVSSTGSAS